MTTKREFMKSIKTYATELIKKGKWEKSSVPFGHYKPTSEKSYFYEFYCYLRILKDLKENYKLIYHKGVKGFPLGPSKKEEKSRFDLVDKITNTVAFQFCSGVEIVIKGSGGDTAAPDISIQKPNAGDNPSYRDVLLIMDSKYHYDEKGKISYSDLREFAKIVQDLDVAGTSSIGLNFNKYIDLQSNCLITNTKAVNKPDYCRDNKIKQIENFDKWKKYSVVG